LKFKKKLVSRVKEFREALDLPQQKLAKKVGVSRQAIYYLETGKSNPSLTVSLNISKILGKPIEEIFYFEPIIRELILDMTVGEMKEISDELGIDFNRIMKLTEIDEEELDNLFTEIELQKIAKTLGQTFDELFEE
jgi:putative transcriptional regulator